jgi:hypothetical protein
MSLYMKITTREHQRFVIIVNEQHFCVFVKGNKPIRTPSKSSVLIGSFWGMLSFDELYVNIRENRMCNQGWTIKRLGTGRRQKKKTHNSES